MQPLSCSTSLIRHLLLAFVLAAPGACQWSNKAPDAVATVDAESISKAQFDDAMARNLKRYNAQGRELPPTTLARVQENVLRRMIEDLTLSQRAQREGITITEDELNTAFETHRQRFRDEDAFADYLARANLSEATLKEELRRSLLKDRVIDKLGGAPGVSVEEIRREYDQHPEKYTEPEQMQVRRLMLPIAADASGQKRRRIWEDARQYASLARAHPEKFSQLCRKHSLGPEAAQGGDMGVIPVGRLPELDRLLTQGLKENAVSGVVDAGASLCLYQISHHRPERLRPLDEVEGAIRAALSLRRQASYRAETMEKIWAESDIKILAGFMTPSPASAPRLDGRPNASTAPLTPPDAPPIRAPGQRSSAPTDPGADSAGESELSGASSSTPLAH